MSLKNQLSLLSIGSTLIASQFPWFVSSSEEDKTTDINIIDDQRHLYGPEPEEEDEEDEKELNIIASINSKVRNGTSKPASWSVKKKNDSIFIMTPKDKTDVNHLLLPLTKEMDFSLPFGAKKYNYAEYKKSEIKISLFAKPAWESETKKDEYSTVDSNEVMSLFEGTTEDNEYKVKQLLLSLTSRRSWYSYNQTREEKKDIFSPKNVGWIRPSGLDDLGDLKIKYFTEFSALRDYVKSKVASCPTEDFACVANPEELDIFEYDQKSHYEGHPDPEEED